MELQRLMFVVVVVGLLGKVPRSQAQATFEAFTVALAEHGDSDATGGKGDNGSPGYGTDMPRSNGKGSSASAAKGGYKAGFSANNTLKGDKGNLENVSFPTGAPDWYWEGKGNWPPTKGKGDTGNPGDGTSAPAENHEYGGATRFPWGNGTFGGGDEWNLGNATGKSCSEQQRVAMREWREMVIEWRMAFEKWKKMQAKDSPMAGYEYNDD